MTTRIDADLLIPGTGDPIENGTVVIDGGQISYAGPSDGAPARATDEHVHVPTVMPGMWDCHIHFFGTDQAAIESLITLDPHIGILRAAQDARNTLDAGFTSVREVGGYGTFLARGVDEGTVVGPHIYGAGGVLSQTGGHGDVHSLSVEQVDDLFERHVGAPTMCDGPEDCRRIVRRQLRLGARVIKVCASGGVMSQVDHPIHQQFTVEELRAAVEEAARADRIVAAHCHGKPGIMAALEAGVKTIEHGTYLDEEAATAMLETGAILVPTRFVVDHLIRHGRDQGIPDYAFEKITAIGDQHLEAIRLAIDAGVTIATGTDIFVRSAYGHNGRELQLLVEAGMTPLAAIEAATANGPSTLGPQAPASGLLREGFDADVIAVDGDPLANISILADKARVTDVWKAGVRVKG